MFNKNELIMLFFLFLFAVCGGLFNIFNSSDELNVIIKTDAFSAKQIASKRSTEKLEVSKAVHTNNKININSGNIDQLMTIKGIGKKMAERIINFREKHGEFTKVSGLLKIKGIGKKRLQKMSASLEL